MCQHNRDRRWRERGQNMVELAISLPLLLFLIFGIVDMGFMFNNWLIIENAARNGATTAISEGATAAEVLGAVEQAAPMSDGGQNPAFQVQITPSPTSFPLTPGQYVEVKVSYAYPFLSPYMPEIFGGMTYEMTSFDIERVQ